jgi:hypothetical protein
MSPACSFDGCTVAETGICALEKDPNTCSNRQAGVAVPQPLGPSTADESIELFQDGDSSSIGAPVLASPEELPSFPPSTTLGPEAIEQLMSSRYVTVVGILGDPESGKTACLASLYLLVSNALLDGWSYADSLSLMAFEEIARGARRWNEGNQPAQMTSHTEMADERRPGFLHLRLRRTSDGRRVDLALPDLPGEWTKSFIRSARSDRLEFVKSADVIWLVVDGRTLMNRERRQGVITRLGQLARRLSAMVEHRMPRMLLVVSHRDIGETPIDVLDRIHQEMAKHNVTVDVMPVAPFSDDAAFKAGFGLAELVSATVGEPKQRSPFWPTSQSTPGARAFLSYRTPRDG